MALHQNAPHTMAGLWDVIGNMGCLGGTGCRLHAMMITRGQEMIITAARKAETTEVFGKAKTMGHHHRGITLRENTGLPVVGMTTIRLVVATVIVRHMEVEGNMVASTGPVHPTETATLLMGEALVMDHLQGMAAAVDTMIMEVVLVTHTLVGALGIYLVEAALLEKATAMAVAASVLPALNVAQRNRLRNAPILPVIHTRDPQAGRPQENPFPGQAAGLRTGLILMHLLVQCRATCLVAQREEALNVILTVVRHMHHLILITV